jgi:hypothetical protein
VEWLIWLRNVDDPNNSVFIKKGIKYVRVPDKFTFESGTLYVRHNKFYALIGCDFVPVGT